MRLAILFGGSSNESDVSIVSACSIIKNLDKDKYKITPIYLDKDNNFYVWKKDIKKIDMVELGYVPYELKLIKNPFSYLKKFDIVFVMIHGALGEDGIISAILDFLNIAYVGNKMMASAITMDKVLTKQILESNNIKTSPYITFLKYNNEYLYLDKSISYDNLKSIILKRFKYPFYVKPSSSGSSIGITRVKDKNMLDEALKIAFNIDNKILIEENIIGKEIECGILEKDGKIIASIPGEVKVSDNFYSYDKKYLDKESITLIPANIDSKMIDKIKNYAIKIFKILNLHQYSRIDFFLTNKNEVILNEINTIPGFTEISMYPKMFIKSGISYSDLLDTLIKETKNNR